MQKFSRSLFALFSFLFFSFCTEAQRPRVVATINIIADMATQVAGNHLEVVSLLPAGTDPHTYEPSPRDAVSISKASLILKNGLHLEGWLDKLIASAGQGIPVGEVTSKITPIQSSDYQNSFDPHAWMTLPNARLYVEAIEEILSGQFPEHEADFKANKQIYLTEIQNVEKNILDLINQISPEKRFLITSHDAFRYFSKTYGFQVASILGTSTDADVNLKDINQLIKIVKENKVPAIFVEMAINPKILEQLAKDLNISIGGKLFTDSFGPKGSAADSYLKMMYFNVATLSQGLASVPQVQHTGNSVGSFSILSMVLLMVLVFTISFLWVKWKVYPQFKAEANWKDYQLEINNLSVMVEEKIILSNLYLRLRPGNLYGILGANGSGKSTLVKTIVGLFEPLSGQILMHGKPATQFLRQIAYLPQKEDFDMQFPATVEDVVKLGFFPGQSGLGKLSGPQNQQFEKVLDQLEIRNLKDRQISQLSGGQFQRTLLARALCQKAEVFILDEPFVGVDHATEEIIIGLLKNLVAEGKMVLMVHHDLTKVKSYFDHVVMINQRIIAYGPTEEVFTEENIQETYSGKVTLLQKALQLVKS
jgi:ABC-type Mn2+/Zn2+ transport system ATPase subunit/ABC-type Zn uptake system ZnuABC Zn-binding protein ZnuA